ncbi:serine carboxypeptidase-like protein [Medicago truncatula]|uniref:Serine carboxypeptidase-like protein n=1 Tax=Medicago truncatula TaxID=3880 RepID=A0A072TJF9_MEDTR|nr:serine carboxypeptidase-like protein [Medicago truncatula]
MASIHQQYCIQLILSVLDTPFVNTLSLIKSVKASHVTHGYIIGNGVTDEQIDDNALISFVHGMGLIPDELFEERPWLSNGQDVGYTKGYDHNLNFLTIKGARHTVPEYKPQEAKMMDLERIRHATTFLQWDKGNYYIFQIKPSLHFIQWDPEGSSLVHRRSRQ